MLDQPFLTIVTPTRNRAHLLPRLMQSFMAAEYSEADVEWLIVDDGSTDDTQLVVAEFAPYCPVPLRVVYQPHGGKHRALNMAFREARGQWCAIIDSDDRLALGGLRAIQETAEAAETRGTIGAFMAVDVLNRKTQHRFAVDGRCLTYEELLNTGPTFDCTLMLRRGAKLRAFPEIPSETFLAESALMLSQDRDSRWLTSNRSAVSVEYQADGLSARMLEVRMHSPVGSARLYSSLNGLSLPPMLRARVLANFGRFWWHALLANRRPPWPGRPLCWIAVPMGLPFALFDHWSVRRRRSEYRSSI
tara:strand:+ start:295 stop:1206 length:912 start_codon:yes stop_codon:yes gene_type:complete